MLGGALSVATGEIAVQAFEALGGAVTDFLGQAMATEKQQAGLAAVIKSTGGAAGLTQSAVNDLAQQFKGLAGGSDEAIVSIETIGLRSGQINANAMPQFIKNVTDLGTVMGDTSAAATLLARAQDDPEAAFKRIERSTGAYDVALGEQIKKLQKAGDTAGATALVMQFVADKTGGAAAAAADTMSGRWEIMSNELQDAGKGILTAVLPAMETLFDSVIKPAIPVIENLANIFANNLGSALAVVTDSISLFTDQTTGAVDIGGVISNILYNMGGAFADLGDAVVALSTGDLPGLWTALSNMISTIAAELGPKLKEWATAFIAWVGPMIPPLLLELGKLEFQFLGWLIAQIPPLIAQLELWGQEFINWVAPQIPPLIAEGVKLFNQLIAWLAAQIPPLIAQLLQWGQEFINWVAPQIPPLIAEGVKLFNQLIAWLAAQIPPLIAQLLEWGQEFVNWVGPQIPPLLIELGKLLGQMTAWIITTGVPALVEKIKEWATAFMDWVMKPGGAKDQVLPALAGFLTAVGKFVVSDMVPGFIGFAKSFIDGLLSGFNTNLPTLLSNVQSIGSSIISSIVAGINAAPGAIFAALKSIVDGAIAGIIAGLTGGGGGGGGGGGSSTTNNSSSTTNNVYFGSSSNDASVNAATLKTITGSY